MLQVVSDPDPKLSPFQKVGVPDDLTVPAVPPAVGVVSWPPRIVLDDAAVDGFATSPFPPEYGPPLL